MNYLLYTCMNAFALALAEFPFIAYPPYNPTLNKLNFNLPSETIIEKQEVRALPTQFELVVGEPFLGQTHQQDQTLQKHLSDRENGTSSTPLISSTSNSTTRLIIKTNVNNLEPREQSLFEQRFLEKQKLLPNAVTVSTRESDAENDIRTPVSVISSVILPKQQRTSKPSTNTSNHFVRYIKQRNDLSDTGHSTLGTTADIVISRKVIGLRTSSISSSTSKPNINNKSIIIDSPRFTNHSIFPINKKAPVTVKNRTVSILTSIPNTSTKHSTAETQSTPIPNITFTWNNINKTMPLNKSRTEIIDGQHKLSYTLHHGTQKLTRV